ncbi:MAG: SDR family NAD(P)-dependent oxidoreductase, partial [Actinomycetota bacterium]|nr:SDR family NAD(P)-dependent oxidoreductase [Actinomycetota bacterium]
MHAVEGKVAVVTGGANGIGAAIVRVLGDAGAHVTVFDLDGTDGSPVDVTCESLV